MGYICTIGIRLYVIDVLKAYTMQLSGYLYTAFIVALVGSGCTRESELSDADLTASREAHVVTENGFGCTSYEYVNLIENEESVRFMEVVGDLVYYVNFDNEIKVYSIGSQSRRTLLTAHSVSELDRSGNELSFCTWSGIFTVDGRDPESFRKVSELSCNSLDRTEEGRYYFTGLNYRNDLARTDHRYIYEVVSVDSVRQVTEEAEEAISKVRVLPDGSIISFNAPNTDAIYHYDPTGAVEQVFDPTNSGLNSGHHESAVWTVQREGRFIAVLKNGYGFPDILEWDRHQFMWHDYVNENVLSEEESVWKLSDFIAPTYSDVTLKNGFLYIATTLAGCRGIQRIDLNAVGADIRMEDVTIIRDAGLAKIGSCIQGIRYDVELNRFIVYSQKGLVIVSRCDG